MPETLPDILNAIIDLGLLDMEVFEFSVGREPLNEFYVKLKKCPPSAKSINKTRLKFIRIRSLIRRMIGDRLAHFVRQAVRHRRIDR
jgi:hypothetical protein